MRSSKKILFIIFMFIFFIGSANASSKEKVTFSKCVDGDTIKVNIDGEINIVRMLAIDTPESVHPTKGVEYYGEEASNYTCNLVTNAKKIELEYDKNSDKKDKEIIIIIIIPAISINLLFFEYSLIIRSAKIAIPVNVNIGNIISVGCPGLRFFSEKKEYTKPTIKATISIVNVFNDIFPTK